MTDAMRQIAETFSCPGCGGRPVWDPESGDMKCPFCGATSHVEQDSTPPEEYDLNAAPNARQQDWGEKKRVIRCQSCGAQTVLGEKDSATFCAFCGSPHVLEDQSEAGIRPESVLPFRVGQKTAVASFRKWLKGKLFAPGKAKKMAHLGKITGIYLPHWTYDDEAASDYVGQAGHHYYVEVPVTVERDGKQTTEMRREQRTRWEPAFGHVEDRFDDVVIPGSQRLDASLLERVQPYDLKGLRRYRAEYLSGFAAEKPAVSVTEGWSEAQKRIENHMRDLARADILSHADEAQVSSLNTRHCNTRYKLTLLPMYLSSFQFKNKAYHVLVNGQTGRCDGQAPVSPWRVLLAIVIGVLVCVGLYYLFDGMTA